MKQPYAIVGDSEPVTCFRIGGELDREFAEGGTVSPPRRAESSQPNHTAVADNDLVTGKEPLAWLDRKAGGVADGSVFNEKRTGSLCIGTTEVQKRTTAESR
ncbi:hypothetical protein [Stenotrophomonas sp. 57]|uniref:hypothetical protein n=1 Tax=Stenotrophomonas sp. 57 TaxID=3051119 RepID=UPI00256F3F10|nr:hypothetical protein [Stenotrophomonas sp. 57]